MLDAFQPRLKYFLHDEARQREESLPVDGGLATALVRLERSRNGQELESNLAHLWYLLRYPKYKGLRINILVWVLSRFKPDIKKHFEEKLANSEEEQAMLAENIQAWGESIREEAWKDGRTDGWKDGRAEGRNEGILSVVLNMLKEKFSFDQISKVTGFSLPEVERLAAEHKCD